MPGTLEDLKRNIRFRDTQFDLLNALLSNEMDECSPVLFVHGYKSVGKTLVVNEFLQYLNAKTTYIRCDEVFTSPLLLRKCLKKIREDSGMDLTKSPYFYEKGKYFSKLTGCDTFSNFLYNLEGFVKDTEYKHQHFLVLDRLDQHVDDPTTLINSFIRMRDCSSLKNVFIIIISRMELPSTMVTTEVPLVFFNPYSDQQIVKILQANQFCFFGDNDLDSNPAGKQFWNSYVQVAIDLYYDFAGSNIPFYVELCRLKWDQFVQPVRDGDIPVNEFLKVYQENKQTFQDSTAIGVTVTEFRSGKEEPSGTLLSLGDITYVSKFILIASFLASYIDPRFDVYYFTRAKNSKLKPKKKFQDLSKKNIDFKLLQPNYFDLERLFAILLVIFRNESKNFNKSMNEETTETELVQMAHEISKFSLAGNIDLHVQLATLLSRGFLFRQVTRDILQPKNRWRCVLGWDTVKVIAADIGFPIENYLN